MKRTSIIAVAILASGIFIAGCRQEAVKKVTPPPGPTPAANASEDPLADFAGYLPTDPVDTVELTEAEQEIMDEIEDQMAHAGGHETKASTDFAFQDPVRVQADGKPIKVDLPGYACPTLADVNEDGKLDLVVGQFTGGKMRFFENIAKASDGFEFAAETWISTGDQPAEVPGVS